MVRGTWAGSSLFCVELEPPALVFFTTEHHGSPTLCFYWFGLSLADPSSMTEKKVLKISQITDILNTQNVYLHTVVYYLA